MEIYEVNALIYTRYRGHRDQYPSDAVNHELRVGIPVVLSAAWRLKTFIDSLLVGADLYLVTLQLAVNHDTYRAIRVGHANLLL